MSVNETATQNVWQHHFPEPWGRGGNVDKLAHRGIGNRKMIDSSLPPVTHIWVTLLNSFYHKMDTKGGFEEKCLK
jgi:hypothetical protein